MENKIPTAEEILRNKYKLEGTKGTLRIDQVSMFMKEFAKLHVEAALKGCLNKYHHASEENYVFGSSEIMNAYPLTNIK